MYEKQTEKPNNEAEKHKKEAKKKLYERKNG